MDLGCITINYVHRYRPYDDVIIQTDNSTIIKAQDLCLKRDVCIKRVKIAGQSKKEVASNLEKAMKEAAIMSRIGSDTRKVPIIFLTSFEEKTNELSIIMEWIRGNTLRHHIQKNMHVRQALNVMIELCSILKLMEDKNYSHRDIKPENIMLDNEGNVVLLDFNISTSLPNRIEGTPIYKAPEMGEDITYTGREKVDIFSIGVILYEIAVGTPPLRGKDYYKKSRRSEAKCWDVFKHPKEYNPQITDSLDRIITKCMELNPQNRYGSVAQLREDLRRERSNGFRKENKRGTTGRSAGRNRHR